MKWKHEQGCGGTRLYVLTDGDYILASIAKDAGAWRIWLPGSRKFANPAGHDRLRDAKAQAVRIFQKRPTSAGDRR